MANREYRTNGSAAYDYRRSSAARPLSAERELPQDRPAAERRVRAKMAVSPFAALGIVAVACVMVLVIFGYVQIYEESSRIGQMQTQLSDLQAEQVELRSKYEGLIDFRVIEDSAARMGMSKPTGSQTVYLNLSGGDRAEVVEGSGTVLASFTRMAKSAFDNLAAYLDRPAA